MNLIMLGAPGAGKGTQAEKISEKYSIPTISTGEILRNAISTGTELGKTAKSYMDAGQLVPDDVVIGIIRDFLKQDSCKNGFILDGFPRSIPQAEALDNMGVKIDAVVSIEVADEKIVERMSGRRVCPTCGASYHILYKPSEKEGICTKCGADLIIRKDDNPDTVLARLHTYHQQTEPLKGYYANKGILIEIEGQEEVADTTALTFAALAKL
jgi:adenylate kinase